MLKENKWGNVRISHELIESIDKIVGTRGYSSRADVVADAVRRFLEQLPRREMKVEV